MQNGWLLTAGVLNLAAALAHLACIVGGAAWYRFFGAGERMARLVERNSVKPTLITLSVAAMLAVWSAFAFSGAGVIGRLPLLRPALLAITSIYLLRALALPILFKIMPDRSARFLVWSSAIVLAFGAVHAIGVIRGWNALG